MKRISSIVLCLLLFTTMLVACNTNKPNDPSSSTQTQAPGTNEATPYTIACIYGEVAGDFWGIVYNGCNTALEELKAQGIEGYCVAPGTAYDAVQQIELIETAMLNKVDGIVLCPANSNQIGTYVTDNFTEKDGIPIIVIDFELETTSPWLISEVMADTYKMGEECGKMAIEALDGKGKYVCIGIDNSVANWENRSVGADDYIKKNAPDMEMIGEIYWGYKAGASDLVMPYVQDILTAEDKDTDIVFITSAEGYTNIVASAIGEVAGNRTGKTEIVGFDFSEASYGLLKTGKLFGTCGQNPYAMGYDSTYLMVEHLNGEQLESFVSVPYQVVRQDNMTAADVKKYRESMGLEV